MLTQFCKITDSSAENERIITEAALIIQQGGLVAIPTETVYGLAGSALLADSAKKIFSAKGRPSDNPLIVHISKPEEAETIAHTSDEFYTLAKRFMPGPLTIILPKKDVVPKEVTGGLDSVAVRCPAHPIARRLIEASGHPIAAPSANRSGIPSPTCANHVLLDMDGRIDMIIDGGECDIGLESTVIKLDGNRCTILRPGAVTAEMLSEICSEVTISKAVLEPALGASIKAESPGMKYKHYSPSAEVILIDADADKFAEYVHKNAVGKYGILVTNEDSHYFNGENILSLGSSYDSRDASKRLFNLLRSADDMKLDLVFARLAPNTDEYMAYNNRLIRAAGCKILKLHK